MTEWHITPDYIVNNWTDELFYLMCEKLTERKKRELETVQGKTLPNRPPVKPGTKVVSDDELLAKMNIKVKKHGH